MYRVKKLNAGIRLENLLLGVYIIIYIAIMFCGNTFLLNYASQLMVVELLITIILIIFRSKNGFVNKKNQISFLLLICFVIFMIVQLSFAYDKQTTLVYIKRYITYAFLLLFITSSDIHYKIIRAIRIYSFIVALSILIEAMIYGSMVGGLLGNYQAAGMMMSVSASVFFMDFFLTSNKMDIVGIIMSVLALLTSGKRMFAILVVIGFIGAYYLAKKSKKNKKDVKKKFWIIAMLSAIVIGIAIYRVPQFQAVIERFMDLSGGSEEEATSGRSILWDRALYIFRNHKIAGIGFANFAVYFENHFLNSGANAFLTHNIYYGLLAETGIIGFTIMVLFMLESLIYSIYLYVKATKSNGFKLKYIMIYSLIIQIWFIVYGYTGNGIYDTNEFFFYVMAIAAVHSVRREFDRINYNETRKEATVYGN